MSYLRDELESMKKEMFEICSGEARALGLATVALADPSEDEAESEESKDASVEDKKLFPAAGQAVRRDDGRRVFRDARGKLWELVKLDESPHVAAETKNTESDYNLPSCERDEGEDEVAEEDFKEEGEWSAERRKEPVQLFEINESNIIRYNVMVTEEQKVDAAVGYQNPQKAAQEFALYAEAQSSHEGSEESGERHVNVSVLNTLEE